MRTILCCIMFALFIVVPVTCSCALPQAGIVKNVSGDVQLVSGQVTVKAVANMIVKSDDTIITGTDGATGIIFEDDTVLSIGPNSEFVLSSYCFNPAEKELSFVARLLKGTFTFVSGQIAKLAPEKVQLETPDATLGVRGTKFLVKVDE